MRKSRFTEEQIVQVLHEWDAGAKVADVIRRNGVTEQTRYRWKEGPADCNGPKRSDSKRWKKRIGN